MAEIKGVLLTAWMTFLKNRYGEQAVTSALTGLNTEDRLRLSSTFLPSSWYSYDTLHTLRQLTRKLASPAETRLSGEIGAFMAEYTFTGVYRSLLAHDPIKQVTKFEWIGEFFFKEARTLKTEITGDTSCSVRYHYESGAAPTKAICESLSSFWSRTLELAGAARVSSSHPKCIVKGDHLCEFTFKWDRST
jgi:hypothetical protein